ncbi:LLM class flavin-dependent oxidoreductase [Pseudonocardia zijingensis]|uniref:Luciferase-like domain-containing protein n=1 Tax=Pseudonocardia zijingensis TaxID=153376 RepID=A0ABP4AFY5_9PSEU
MRLAVALHESTGTDGAALVDDAVRTTRAARDAGYSGVVAGQHFLTAPRPYLQPLPLLTRLIPESGDMRLVAGVLLLPLLDPVQLAEELATVDTLCGGRLVVGAGAGYRPVEFAAFGVSRAERRTRQLRALDEMVAWWQGAEVRGTGARLGLRPVACPHPPVWLAASGPRSYGDALDRGHTPFLGPQVAPGRLAELLRTRPTSTPVALRRDVLVTDVVAPTAAADAIARRAEQNAEWGYGSATGESPYLVGSAAECRERIAELEALGVTDLVIRTNWAGITADDSREMLAALTG